MGEMLEGSVGIRCPLPRGERLVRCSKRSEMEQGVEREKERKQGVARRVRDECGEEWKCVAIRSVTMTRRESALRSLE